MIELSVRPFLKMETLGLVAKMARDIVRPAVAVGRGEDVSAARLEHAMDQLQVRDNVLRVEVFQKLSEGMVSIPVLVNYYTRFVAELLKISVI